MSPGAYYLSVGLPSSGTLVVGEMHTGLITQDIGPVEPGLTVAEVQSRLATITPPIARGQLDLRQAVEKALAAIQEPWEVEYTVEAVHIKGAVVPLASPVRGRMTIEDELYSFEIPELEVFIKVERPEDIGAELDRQMEDLIEEYVDADDSELDGPARELKKRLRAVLGRQ